MNPMASPPSPAIANDGEGRQTDDEAPRSSLSPSLSTIAQEGGKLQISLT